MSTYTDNTAFFAALKQFYSDQRVHNLVYANRPLFAMLQKKEDMGGYTKPIPLINSLGGAPGSDFATVQANQAPLGVKAFLIAVSTAYQVSTIKGVTIAASRGAGARAFLDATVAEADAKLQSISNYLAQGCYGSGTGSIGQVGAPTTGGAGPYTCSIVLKDISDVVAFELGYVIQWRATDGAASADAAEGTVTSIDRSTGTVVVGGASAFTGWLANGYLNVKGNSSAGANTALAPTAGAPVKNIVGLKGWCPDTAPAVGGGDAFWGVDRSADVTRLAGHRFDGTGKPLQEALIDALSIMWREGARPDKVFTNAITFAALQKSYEGKSTPVHMDVAVGRSSEGKKILIGFDGIKVAYAGGTVDVYADPFCPGKRLYIVQMENIALESMGPAPQWDKGIDGLTWLRVSNDDAYECRFKAYAQFSCNAPGHLGVVTTSV